MVCLSVVLSVRLNILSCKGFFGFPFSVFISPIFVSPFRSSFEKWKLLTFMIRLIYIPTVWFWLLDNSLSPWSLAPSLWLSASFIDSLWPSAFQVTPVFGSCVFMVHFSLGFLRVSSDTWKFVWDVNFEPIHDSKCQLVFLGTEFKLLFLNIEGITYSYLSVDDGRISLNNTSSVFSKGLFKMHLIFWKNFKFTTKLNRGYNDFSYTLFISLASTTSIVSHENVHLL